MFLLKRSRKHSCINIALGFFLIFISFYCEVSLAHPQLQDKYEKILQQADQNYRTGKFNEAIILLADCLVKPDMTDKEKIRAYRLLGLVNIAKDDLSEAKKSIEKLLQLNPDYQPDLNQDPPPFVKLIEEEKAARVKIEQIPEAKKPIPPKVTLVSQQSQGIRSIGVFLSAIKFIGGNKDDSIISPWIGLTVPYTFSSKIELELNAGMGSNFPKDPNKSGIAKWISRRPETPYRTYLYPLIVNFRYNLIPDSKIKPFVLFGLGTLFWNLREASSDHHLLPLPPSGKSLSGRQMNALANMGVGFEVVLSDKIGLNISGRYQRLFDQDKDMSGYRDVQTGNLEARLGVNYHFRIWKDSDGDGIEDKMDMNPKSPEDFDGFQDEDGAPDLDNDNDGIPDLKDQAPDKAEDFDGFEDTDGIPDLDNDQDGIPDTTDKAPNQPEDFDGFLDEDGAPDLDNDNDGIPDEKDQAPNRPETFNGFEDEDGVPDTKPEIEIDTKAPIILEGVNFKTGSSDLTENAKRILEKVYKTLIDYPDMKIEVRGHTDNTGNASLNKKLSQRRADSVKNFLILKSIDPGRIVAIGYGEENPIASNTTEDGRAKNRRIELIRLQ